MNAALKASGQSALTELRVDGGASAMDSMLQLQADQLQVPVIRPRDLETTSLGAAYLAGLSVGFWDSLDDIADNWQIDRRFQPSEATAGYDQWTRAVARVRA